MLNETLNDFYDKCRLCLQDLTPPDYFTIDSEIFHDLTNSQVKSLISTSAETIFVINPSSIIASCF